VLTFGLVSVILGTASGAQNTVGLAFLLRGGGGGTDGSTAAQGDIATIVKDPAQR